jgi:hypothetical protein
MSFRSAGVRVVAAMVLVTIALVPTMARAHDRLERQRTPAQEHSRFRWTNSCESVPQKDTTIVAVAPADGPAEVVVDVPPPRSHAAAPESVPPPQPPSFRSPHGLRAPPPAFRS